MAGALVGGADKAGVSAGASDRVLVGAGALEGASAGVGRPGEVGNPTQHRLRERDTNLQMPGTIHET